MGRIISLALSCILAAFIIVMWAGFISDKTYTGQVQAHLPYNSDIVWTTLIDIEATATKKNFIQDVTVIERYGKLVAWRETMPLENYRTYRMYDYVDGESLTIELTDSSYGLTGTWKFELTETSDGTRVIIREDSTFNNTFHRGLRYFFGRDRDMQIWLKYLRVGSANYFISAP